MRTYRKAVEDVHRRGIDWSDRLVEGDSIAASSWVVGQGLTGTGSVFTDTYADIDLSGGTAGSQYTVTNEVDTSQGLTYSRSFKILVY